GNQNSTGSQGQKRAAFCRRRASVKLKRRSPARAGTTAFTVNSFDETRVRPALSLSFGFRFEDLYTTEGLRRLDAAFLEQLGAAHPELRERIEAARVEPSSLSDKQRSELIVAAGPYLEDFIGELFGISADLK